MANYKVLSDNFAGGEKGTTVDGASLEGCNIPALIEGGHLVEIGAKSKQDKDSE